jgi:hypothetical protein
MRLVIALGLDPVRSTNWVWVSDKSPSSVTSAVSVVCSEKERPNAATTLAVELLMRKPARSTRQRG